MASFELCHTHTQIVSDRNTDERQHNSSCEKQWTDAIIHIKQMVNFIHKQNNSITE